jgi:uncharacterized membrane protein
VAASSTRICSLFTGVLLAGTLLLTYGCGSGDRPLSEVDPDAVPADPDFQLVWNIMQRDCTPCHKSGGGGDYTYALDDGTVAEEEDPDLSTCAGIVEAADDIISSVIYKNDMPPGAWPRLTSEEKLILQRWVDNGTKVPTPCP